MELSVKFASQICYENIKKPLYGIYLADFGIDINVCETKSSKGHLFFFKKKDAQLRHRAGNYSWKKV